MKNFYYYISMRVIAGKYRGKKLKEFDLSTTRPTLDRVKEGMFNLIQFGIDDAVVCDLFSGTGALGIECISRGAKKVYFVDKNLEAIKIIKSNLSKIDGNYEIINDDYLNFLSRKIKFDIVLLDPPFKTDYGIKAINYIVENDLLNTGGIILFETSDEKEVDFTSLPLEVKRKKYGTVAVYKLEKV